MEFIKKLRFFLKRVDNCKTSITHEFRKDENTLKGEIFEEYVRRYLFPKDRYELLYKTPAFDSKDFVKSLTFPDFLFQCKETGRKLAVEAKYRSSHNPSFDLELCKDFQLKRYKDFATFQSASIYIILGLGGPCHNPNDLYLVPISNRTSAKVSKSELSHFRANKKHVINLSFIKSLELEYADK